MTHRDDSKPIRVESHPLRRHPRINLALSVRLRFASVGAVLESKTVDISEGGVFIRMSNPRPEGTAIRLQLEIGSEQLSIHGVVVRCVRPEEGEPPGIGVLFTEMTDTDRARVHEIIERALDGR